MLDEEKEVLQTISMNTVQYIHETVYEGHWFDDSSKKFFNSRWGGTAYKHQSLNVAFFVSSEKFNYGSDRLYTIRAVNMLDGSFISEVKYYPDGESKTIKELSFQNFISSRLATETIKRTNWTKVLKEWV